MAIVRTVRAKKQRSKTRSGQPRQEPARPRFQGWRTSDDDEIERRRIRGRESEIRLEPLEEDSRFFGTFLGRSARGETYSIEIRSLEEPINSCDCPDYQVNGLGTCKHIEATLYQLQKGRRRGLAKAAAQGSPRIEVFLDHRDERVKILWPRNSRKRSQARGLLSPFFSSDGALLTDPLSAVPALHREVEKAPAGVRRRIRISRHLAPWLARSRQHAERASARRSLEADVAAGKLSVDLVDVPLYPYQQDGMLHLAFTGRGLLADEMGLGKTVQAIAACELLRRQRGIQRVLVVSPASLKAEWEEQIAKFTGLPSLVIQGTRADRLRQYRQPAFFYLTNYEQIRPDGRDINRTLAPDVVILDEAQRIKNWQTKTADAVKRLSSPYAFVLTGTPLENRIDEVYSIVQFLDPHIFGPLFRFNRDFYTLDERGRPAGYKNLDEMHRRLRPVMLRRRKDEVEDQLPGRTVNTFFVGMHPEQAARYEEYSAMVARLVAQSRRRPLTPDEMDKLQKWLACMRMLCDTPYILDRNCRIAPKLQELANILRDLAGDERTKLIVFSEWERMLELVREQAEHLGLGYAWHTGSVPQARRRPEIRRFKDDPACRLFLSTDAGSVGLNLQAANVVINMDQPWNPAKLEQRIARAWRKHQTRPVQVINLVTEHSIEHRMLHLLAQKRTLAEGVVDGAGKVTEMKLPSGRAAFLERVQALTGEPAATVSPPGGATPSPHADPAERLQQDVMARWGGRLDLLELHGDGAPAVVAVLDRLDETAKASIQSAVETHLGQASASVETLDRQTYATIQRLVETGVLSVNAGPVQILHRSPALQKHRTEERERRLAESRRRLSAVEPKQRMARVLAEGGFPVEGLAPLREAVEKAVAALAYVSGEDQAEPVPLALVESHLVKEGMVSADTLVTLARLRETRAPMDESHARALLAQGHAILDAATGAVDRAALR